MKEEEEADEGNYTEKLSAAVGNLFQVSQGTFDTTGASKDTQTSSPQGIKETRDDVGSFESNIRSSSQWNELLGTLPLEDIDAFDYSSFPYELAPLLDPETYSSITGTTVFPKNSGPVSYNDYDDGKDGDENDEYYNYRANMDPEELHQLIVEQEPGYYSQSDEFKEALLYSQMQNRSYYSQKAAKLRRSTEWSARQQKTVQDLEREMDSFERDLEQTLKEKEVRMSKEKQRQREAAVNKQMESSTMKSESQVPSALRQEQEEQQQQQQRLGDGILRSKSLDAAAESFQNERQQQRIEFYRKEINRYKVRAETAEKEVRRLLAVIRSLEEALTASLSSEGTEQSAGTQETDLKGEELPLGWELVEEAEEHGGSYFMNVETGAISYEFPLR